MIRLIVVELRRSLARRITRVMALLSLVCILIAGVWVFAATTDAATQQREYEELVQDTGQDAAIAQCIRQMTPRQQAPSTATPSTATQPTQPGDPAIDDWTPVYQGTASPELVRRYCEQQLSSTSTYRPPPPRPFTMTQLWVNDDTQLSSIGGRRFDATDSFLLLPATLLFLMGLIAGASLIGAEWQSGNMITFLTWEPRRTRVVIAKVLAIAVVVAIAAFVVQALLGLVLFPTAAVKGSTDGMTAHWFNDLIQAMARISLVSALAAAIGAALAMIGRRTALALGIAFIYLAVLENLLVAWKDGLRPLTVSTNTAVFLTGELPRGFDITRSTATAGWTLVVYAAILIAAAIVAFHRRDFASG